MKLIDAKEVQNFAKWLAEAYLDAEINEEVMQEAYNEYLKENGQPAIVS